jgi:hypothetical protein
MVFSSLSTPRYVLLVYYIFMKEMPILIICFNKPKLLKNLLNFLEFTKGTIYIHLDGATRANKNFELNQECLGVIKDFSARRKDVRVKVCHSNLGGQFGVLNAIDWFFLNVERGLILEEDIEISKVALDFVEVFESWLDDAEIFSICLFNPFPHFDSNVLLSHWLPWGWATSRQKWNLLRERAGNPGVRLKFNFSSSPARRFPVRYFLNRVIKKVDNGEVITWDAQIHALILENKLYSIFPAQTQSLHRGNVHEATHADLTDWWSHLNLATKVTEVIDCNYIEQNNRKFERAWRMTWIAILSDLYNQIAFLK